MISQMIQQLATIVGYSAPMNYLSLHM